MPNEPVMELYFNFWQICYQNHSSWVEKKKFPFSQTTVFFLAHNILHIYTHTHIYMYTYIIFFP